MLPCGSFQKRALKIPPWQYKMTGAAEGTIFYHFKNKEDLFLSTLESVKNEIIDQFEHYFRETLFETGLHIIEGAILFYLNLAGAMGDQFLLLHRHDAYEIAKVKLIIINIS